MVGESSGSNSWAFLKHSDANSSVAAGIAGVPTLKIEMSCEKICLQGFHPGPTQTGLYSHRRWLEA